MMKNALLMLLVCVNSWAGISPSAQLAKEIFNKSCVACHGGAQPILFNILDVPGLEAKGLVQGGDQAKLYQMVATDKMPKGAPPLSLTDKQLILNWLSEGYPSFEEEAPPAEPITYGDEVSCIAKDVMKAGYYEALEYRYLTLSSFYNDGGKEAFEKGKEAVTAILNRTSYSPHPIKAYSIPCKGVQDVILRIRLEDYDLRAADWDNFLVKGKYPYFIDYEDDSEFAYYELEIAKRTYAKTLAYIRGDWFVAYVSQPPLYYDALFKGAEVKTIQQLERYLGVDTFRQLFQTYEARRAILRKSGVTNYNRAIDYYELDFWHGGIKYPSSYWKTYDTLGDKSQDYRNLFAFPFGPFYLWYSGYYEWLKNKSFVFDAEEILWNLPNGQLGAFLADRNGNRLDEALTEVAYHHSNTNPYFGTKPGAIRPGVSCYACHSGFNPFRDEGRHHIENSSDFSNEQVDYARQLFFKDQAEIAAYLKKGNDLYETSQKALGAKSVSYPDIKEPVFYTTKRYFTDVDVCGLAAEYGMTCDEMKRRLFHSVELARLLGLSETLHGRVSRSNIEYFQAEIAREFNLGKQVSFGHVTPPPPSCKVTLKNNSKYRQRLDSVVFGGTSYGQEWLNVGAVREYPHDVAGSIKASLFYNSSYYIVQNVEFQKCQAYQIALGTNGYNYIYAGAGQ